MRRARRRRRGNSRRQGRADSRRAASAVVAFWCRAKRSALLVLCKSACFFSSIFVVIRLSPFSAVNLSVHSTGGSANNANTTSGGSASGNDARASTGVAQNQNLPPASQASGGAASANSAVALGALNVKEEVKSAIDVECCAARFLQPIFNSMSSCFPCAPLRIPPNATANGVIGQGERRLRTPRRQQSACGRAIARYRRAFGRSMNGDCGSDGGGGGYGGDESARHNYASGASLRPPRNRAEDSSSPARARSLACRVNKARRRLSSRAQLSADAAACRCLSGRRAASGGGDDNEDD